MKTAFVFLMAACLLLMGCGDKTDDEIRAEKAAKAQGEKNAVNHEKRQ